MHFLHAGVEEGGERVRWEQVGQVRGMGRSAISGSMEGQSEAVMDDGDAGEDKVEKESGGLRGEGDEGKGGGRCGDEDTEEDIPRTSTSCLDTDILGSTFGGGERARWIGSMGA